MLSATRTWFDRLYTRFSRSVWTSSCLVCHRQGCCHLDLCAACWHHLPRLSQGTSDQRTTLCLQCGLAFASEADRLYCQHCVNHTSPYARVVAPFRYAFPLDRLIQRMKYQNQQELARVLGGLLAMEVMRGLQSRIELPAGLPNFILPVPMHKTRLTARGFNQAADIARWCARELKLPNKAGWAQRVVDTGSLAGLSRAERQTRIRGAFNVHAAVADQHIAIVDDVLTTGATTGELTRELLDSGAASVQLWVLARTEAPAKPRQESAQGASPEY